MALPFLAKLGVRTGIAVAKEPEKAGSFVWKLIMGIIGFILLLNVIGLNMVGTFRNEGVITEDFSGIETKAYKDISAGYSKFQKELKQEMNDRKMQLLMAHTRYEDVTYIDEETRKEYTIKEPVCDAEVFIQSMPINVAYYFAYINHIPEEDIKSGKQYVVKEEDVLAFCEQICTFKERKVEIPHPDKEGEVFYQYYLYNEVLSLDEMAELFFADDQTAKDMFYCSYDLYLQFIPLFVGEEGEVLYPDTGMQVPHYFQTDYKNVPYGNGTISSSGCAPTSIAMVLSYLKGQSITPVTVVNWTGNRYYVPGAGSSWSIFGACANHWGVPCNNLGKSLQGVINALNEGKPVIASMGPGTFTKGGHLLVLRGVTSDGYFLVNDPNKANYNKYKTDKFNAKVVFAEAKNFWSFG